MPREIPLVNRFLHVGCCDRACQGERSNVGCGCRDPTSSPSHSFSDPHTGVEPLNHHQSVPRQLRLAYRCVQTPVARKHPGDDPNLGDNIEGGRFDRSHGLIIIPGEGKSSETNAHRNANQIPLQRLCTNLHRLEGVEIEDCTRTIIEKCRKAARRNPTIA